MLSGSLSLSAEMTVLAVLKDTGTPTMYSSVFVAAESYRGLAISPVDCKGGNPAGSAPCTASSERVVAIDWSGSGNFGARDITERVVVAAVSYAAGGATR